MRGTNRQIGKSANQQIGKAAWRVDLYDMLALAGWAMIGYGLSLVSVPLALCVLGAIVMVAGIVGAWRKGRE